MNNLDKNFHINFSPFYAIVVVMMLMFVANKLQAQEIEEIVVIGATVYETESDPSTDVNILESIIPEATTAGGYGSFLGYTERGTQTIHTTIFRNGVPANDAGSGWYDFGHDFSTGNENVKIVNGPNSVLYGSGSLGGSIFITDDLKDGSIIRYGSNTFVSHTVKKRDNFMFLEEPPPTNEIGMSTRQSNSCRKHHIKLTNDGL